MKNRKEAFVQDVMFILNECVRLAKIMEKDGLQVLAQDDALFSLPHPDGCGSMLCGRAAAVKLTTLAEEAARRGHLAKRVEFDLLRTEVSKLVIARFVNEKRCIDVTQVDRLLSFAVKTVKKKYLTLTHLIPCHLMSARDPEQLVIGPVTFHNRPSVRRLLLKKMHGQLRGRAVAENAHWRYLLARAIRYYRNFQWVAEVETVGFDSNTAAIVAEEAVTAALNCLHILFGARWTGRMRVGGVNIRTDRRARLTFAPEGELMPSLSAGGFGEITFPNGWSTRLLDPHFEQWRTIFAVALEAVIDPDLDRPLSRRFLDAAQWFGEACRDESPATRIVKYVTALERMLMTEEHDDVSSVIAERVAMLCFDNDDPRDSWRRRARQAYDIRSRLVHGSISPRATAVTQTVSAVADVARLALLRALDAFGEVGLRAEDMTSKRMASRFQELSRLADAAEAASI